jgi:type II secretory pathway pseudopilin PulG
MAWKLASTRGTTSTVLRRESGFTFVGLLFLIALMGLMAAAAASTWTFSGQREREQELLFDGREYRDALKRYVAAHAGQAQPYPTSLEQLLGSDDRLVPVHYLRRLYFDPITGSTDWGLVKTPQGGISGVYSLSDRRPIRTGAPTDDADSGIAFARATSYRDWVFSAASGDGGVRGAIPGWNYERDGEPPLTWEHPPPRPD